MTSTIPFTIGHGAVIGGLMSNPSGERLYDSIPSAFAKDEEVGFFGARLCEALTAMFQDMDQIVRDTPAGFDPITGVEVPGLQAHCAWSPITAPATAPVAWLPWCGRLYGVVLTVNTTAAQQRAQILELPPQKRGGVAAMVKAAEETLTGAKAIVFVERSNEEAYHITAHTQASETPSETATKNAILTQKPGGLVLTYSASNSPTWAEALKLWNEAAATVEWATVASGQV